MQHKFPQHDHHHSDQPPVVVLADGVALALGCFGQMLAVSGKRTALRGQMLVMSSKNAIMRNKICNAGLPSEKDLYTHDCNTSTILLHLIRHGLVVSVRIRQTNGLSYLKTAPPHRCDANAHAENVSHAESHDKHFLLVLCNLSCSNQYHILDLWCC